MDVGRSVFFTGVTGVGKSVIITDLLNRIKESKRLVLLPLTFSAQTDARKTQETIENKLVKLRRNLLGAGAGKRVVRVLWCVVLLCVVCCVVVCSVLWCGV